MKLKTPKRIVLKMQQKMPRKSWKKKREFQKKKAKIENSYSQILEKENNKETSISTKWERKTEIEDANFWKCSKKGEIRIEIEKEIPQRIKKKSVFENLK